MEVFQSPSAASVPTFIILEIVPVTFMEETVWNMFVVFTVPELDPEIVSVNAAPFRSVPTITKELEVVSLLLDTDIWAPK